MADTPLLQELDRNMDTVFDSLFILNQTMMAIVKSLPKSSALQVVPALDAVLSEIHLGKNPPAEHVQMTLKAWRNVAADIAEFQLIEK